MPLDRGITLKASAQWFNLLLLCFQIHKPTLLIHYLIANNRDEDNNSHVNNNNFSSQKFRKKNFKIMIITIIYLKEEKVKLLWIDAIIYFISFIASY